MRFFRHQYGHVLNRDIYRESEFAREVFIVLFIVGIASFIVGTGAVEFASKVRPSIGKLYGGSELGVRHLGRNAYGQYILEIDRSRFDEWMLRQNIGRVVSCVVSDTTMDGSTTSYKVVVEGRANGQKRKERDTP